MHLDATQQFEKVVDAIRATHAETAEDLADLEEDHDAAGARSAGRRQGRRLRRGVDRAARGHRHWWEEVLACDPDELEEDQEPYTADAAGLDPSVERQDPFGVGEQRA